MNLGMKEGRQNIRRQLSDPRNNIFTSHRLADKGRGKRGNNQRTNDYELHWIIKYIISMQRIECQRVRGGGHFATGSVRRRDML